MKFLAVLLMPALVACMSMSNNANKTARDLATKLKKDTGYIQIKLAKHVKKPHVEVEHD